MGLPKLEHLPHYTYEDYKIWEGNWELINGIPYAMSPAPSIYHQRINRKLINAISESLKSCNTCEAFMPIDWKINEDTVVQPDVSVICNLNEEGKFITQAPKIIFEILSPSTAKKDQNIKFDLYESNGVKYYVIVNPLKKVVEIFELTNGKYQKIKETSEEAFSFDLQNEAECSFSLNFKETW